jgi:hypothetical protein
MLHILLHIVHAVEGDQGPDVAKNGTAGRTRQLPFRQSFACVGVCCWTTCKQELSTLSHSISATSPMFARRAGSSFGRGDLS